MYPWISRTLDFWLQFCEKKCGLYMDVYGIPFALVGYEVIITNLRYALVGYFITSYLMRAQGIIVIYFLNDE